MVASKGPKTPFYLDDRQIIFPWFSGKETPMNRPGDRNFGLTLTKDQADELTAAGYNVKIRKAMPATDEYEERPEEYFIKCKLNFKSQKPPRVVLITCINGVCERTPLNEKSVMLLDSANIEKADVKIVPYDWEQPTGASGRTAYVESMFVTVEVDRYDQKYASIPLSGSMDDQLGDGDVGEMANE
jgi:hypothetical protein